MRLLIITQMVNEHGRLGFFVDWIKEFAKQTKQVSVICLEKKTDSMPKNVKVFSLGKEQGRSKVGQLAEFYRLITSLEYDAVFVHMNPAWVIAGAPVWKVRSKRVYLWYTHKSTTLTLRVAAWLSKRVFTAAKKGISLRSEKVLTVGHGIKVKDFPVSKKQRKGKLKIMSASRITRTKDFATVFEALSKLAIPFQYDIFGDAVTRQDQQYVVRLKKLILELGLEKQVSFKGFIPHEKIVQKYVQYDVVVNQSSTDSFDKAVLEPMACNTPVLTPSRAFKGLLPAWCLFKNGDADDLANKLSQMAKKTKRADYRSAVEKYHSLSGLVGRMLKTMRQG